MDVGVLREAGLTEGESKVYVSLLKLGSSTTGPIVEKSGVAKSIIYQILEKLIEKGLATFVLKDKTRYYQATHPIQLEKYLEEREKEFKKTKKKVENLIPDLLDLKKYSPSEVAQVYVGFKGVQTAHEKNYLKLKAGDEYYTMGITYHEKFDYYWQKDHKRRVKEEINVKLLFNKDTPKKILDLRNAYDMCEARYMPVDTNTPTWFTIYSDTVILGFLSGDEPIAIEINNQTIADSFKEYFRVFWGKSKKV